MVYADKPTTLEALEVNINRAIDEIRPEILEKVVKFCLIGCASQGISLPHGKRMIRLI